MVNWWISIEAKYVDSVLLHVGADMGALSDQEHIDSVHSVRLHCIRGN